MPVSAANFFAVSPVLPPLNPALPFGSARSCSSHRGQNVYAGVGEEHRRPDHREPVRHAHGRHREGRRADQGDDQLDAGSIDGITITNGQCHIGVTTTASANQTVTLDDFTFVRTGTRRWRPVSREPAHGSVRLP